MALIHSAACYFHQFSKESKIRVQGFVSKLSLPTIWSYYVFQKYIFFTFLSLDLSDVISDDDEKENLSPDDIPSTVVIDAFGGQFEEAVRMALVYS